MAGVKPILVKAPCPFKGNHDDIEQFLGDCTTYFKIFWVYYQNAPSLMIPFLTSHLEGEAEDWWVHLRDKYSYVPPEPDYGATNAEIADYDAGPCYRYPDWTTYVKIFREQFRNPAIELVHKKRMGEIKMGTDPAHVYFRKLKRGAKLANQLTNQMEHGNLVKAVR